MVCYRKRNKNRMHVEMKTLHEAHQGEQKQHVLPQQQHAVCQEEIEKQQQAYPTK